MTSQIISVSIDETYPVAGQDNDSQGFRDNFTIIKDGLATAESEITDLQNNTAKTNDDNNFNGYLLDNAQTNRVYGKVFDNGTVSGAVTIDYEKGEYQTFTLSNNVVFTFRNWPSVEDAYSKMRISIKPLGTLNYTVTFLTINGSVVTQNSETVFNTGTDPNVSTVIESWTQRNLLDGNDVYLSVVGNDTPFYTGSIETTSGSAISSFKSVAYFKTVSVSNCTLAAGYDGQVKTLIMDTDGGNMTVAVSSNGWGGSGSLIFTNVGQSCTLQFINSKWFILSNNGVTVA